MTATGKCRRSSAVSAVVGHAGRIVRWVERVEDSAIAGALALVAAVASVGTLVMVWGH
jgi:hypothetical protein